MNSENNTKDSSAVSKILFVIGVIIILIILAFAIIKFVPRIFNGLANVSSSVTETIRGSDNAINVTVNDSDLSDKEIFRLSWNYNQKVDGIYTVSYACTDGAIFDLISDEGNKRLICNTPYNLGSAKQADLVANYSETNTFADIPIVISFLKEGSESSNISGQTIVTVKKTDDAVDEETPTELEENTSGSNENASNNSNVTISSTPTPPTSNRTVSSPTSVVINPGPSGLADLAIINVTSLPNQSTTQFTVANIGGRNTGIWQFTYSSPTTPREIEASPAQPSLAPGQSIRYTLSFARQDNNTEGIAIIVDPGNIVSESNESNNTAAINITGIGSGNNGNNNNNNNGNYNSNDEADFVIDNPEVGYLSGNSFRKDDRLDDGDDAVIRFTVRNRGGETTNDWRFEITDLPFDGNDTYRSGRYDKLRPGQTREITIEFENIDEGDYDIRVEVDSEDDTDEESESNNRKSVNLDVRN